MEIQDITVLNELGFHDANRDNQAQSQVQKLMKDITELIKQNSKTIEPILLIEHNQYHNLKFKANSSPTFYYTSSNTIYTNL